MNVFGIGLPEMMLIFVLALLIFGPKKLPEIGKTLGKTLRSFQDASNSFQDEFRKEAEALENATKQTMTATLEPPAAIAPAADPIEDAVIQPDAATSEPIEAETSDSPAVS